MGWWLELKKNYNVEQVLIIWHNDGVNKKVEVIKKILQYVIIYAKPLSSSGSSLHPYHTVHFLYISRQIWIWQDITEDGLSPVLAVRIPERGISLSPFSDSLGESALSNYIYIYSPSKCLYILNFIYYPLFYRWKHERIKKTKYFQMSGKEEKIIQNLANVKKLNGVGPVDNRPSTN